MEKELVGASWNNALTRLRDGWLGPGRPVALLDGFPGTGKTELAHELGKVSDWVAVRVEPGQSEGSEKDDLFIELASELEARGIDDLVRELDRGESADFIRALKRVLEQRRVLIIIDEVQRVFESDSALPIGALRSLIQKLGDAARVSGRLLLISNRKIEDALWSEKCKHATLGPLSESEAVGLLSRLLAEGNLADAVPAERLRDAALHMGCNPRALHTLVSVLSLNGYTIADLITAFPDVWSPGALETRIGDPALIARLERELLERTLLRVDPELGKFLRWLSVHRRDFGREALPSFGPDHPDPMILRRRLIECFLLEAHRGLDRVHPIAREISEFRLKTQKDEWRDAHGVAADYHLRHFKARQLIGGEALAPSFSELKYHLHHAERLDELVVAARRFTYHLRTSFGTATAIPTDHESLDERIALLSMLLAEPGNKPVEYHLAGCFEKRRAAGDLEKALVHVRRATGANAYYPAWLLRLNIETELHGIGMVSPVISEALGFMSTDSQIFALFQRGSEILTKAGREEEAIVLLKQGIAAIPPDKSVNALYQACAQLLAKNGKSSEAIALLQEGLRTVPKDKGSLSLYQACAGLLDGSGRTADAIAVLRSGIENLAPARNLAPLYQAAAELLQKSGNVHDAITILQEGMNVVPPEQNLRALYQECADLFVRTRRNREASRVLRAGLGAIPVGRFGRYMLSESALRLAAEHGRANEVEEMLRARGKLEIEPQQQILGWCLLHRLRGQWQAIQQEAEAGLKQFPKFEALKHLLAEALAKPKERTHFQPKVEARYESPEWQRDFDAFVILAQDETSKKSFHDWAGGERVTLAIVFTDVVGSTSLGEKIGDEAMREVRRAHFIQSRKLIGKYKGREIKTIGDSFMVAFKCANDGLDYAVDLQRHTGNPQVKIRAGIHVGPMDVEEGDVGGGTVNYAARVVGVIKDAEIWLSDQAKQDIDRLGAARHKQFVWERHEAVDMKGFSGAFTLWSLKI